MDLALKQKQFNAAMKLYETRGIYKAFSRLISVVNVSLQIYLLYRVLQFSIGTFWQFFCLVAAFLLADLLNGLIHMVMDNSDDYTSIAGPLIANFHLHHKRPQYQKNPLYIVYFNETGSKVWLAGYLFAVDLLFAVFTSHPGFLYVLVYFGIISSVAEVSHYLCHSSNSAAARYLARAGLLLSKRHHARHHLEDNKNYAFMNGVTDPLINLVAAKFSRGYKSTTDRHFATYTGLTNHRLSDLEHTVAPGVSS